MPIKFGMAIVFLFLCLFEARAATRRLQTDCTVPPGFTPSESAPFDCDWCTLNDSDDITELLKDIRTEWPSGFYVRAPSKTLTVISDYIAWPTATKYYIFLEDQDPGNKLLIQHKITDPQTCSGAACRGFFTLWKFENFNTVKIGGQNLSITFKGNHPGLANCDVHYRPAVETGWNPSSATICDINYGFIDFKISDNSTAELADVRANIRFAQGYSIHTSGGMGGTTNIIKQLKVAGLHYATSGVFFHAGVRHAWADPDNFKMSDPYVRSTGWTGTVGTQFDAGLPVGCCDQTRDQVRGATFCGYYTDSITGGVTLEHGGGWVQRYTNVVGKGIDDPFVVKFRDWGISGPGTPYPAGVRVKKTTEANFFKGDPHYLGVPGVIRRFVRFEKLPDTYGSGSSSAYGTGCEWVYGDGNSNFARTENSTGAPNRDWHITFAGDWRTPAQGGNFVRGQLFYFAWDDSASYGHVLRAAQGTAIMDLITMHDRNTVTGPGTFADIRVADHAPKVPARGNRIIATNITGSVTIDTVADTTTISNVNFTGAAREIIRIGAGSTALVSALCAAAGCTITGAGTLVYNGQPRVLPYTLAAASACTPLPTEAATGKKQSLSLGFAPNPMRQETRFRIDLPYSRPGRLALYNTAGQEIRSWSGLQAGGKDVSVTWDGRTANGRPLPNGLYLARLSTERMEAATLRVLLSR